MNAVTLVNLTPDAEKTILRVARVSSDPTNENPGLLRYLIRKGHWSPFEHAMMTLEIRTSRAVSQQITRHRSFTFQEFSQRYTDAPGHLIYQGRTQATSNRQSSVDDLPAETQKWWLRVQHEVGQHAFRVYEDAINLGIARECARFVLPLSAETIIHMSGTLRSWIHYLGDGPGGRTSPDTQKEHRDIAEEAKEIFAHEFPIIAQALGWKET